MEKKILHYECGKERAKGDFQNLSVKETLTNQDYGQGLDWIEPGHVTSESKFADNVGKGNEESGDKSVIFKLLYRIQESGVGLSRTIKFL